jgi:starch phosphorylase
MAQLESVVRSEVSNTHSGNEVGGEHLFQKCMSLAQNLWWCWHPEVANIFRDIDPIRWRQLDHNPIALLREFTAERLSIRASEMVLHSRVNYAYRRLQEYLDGQNTWASTQAGVLGAKPVAYFSAEFGMHESIPIYSGGLGVLSGDHIKSASGLGVPLIGIGLYYTQGYFKQHLDEDGYQREEYIETKVENLPIVPALGSDGLPITVSIDTRNGRLMAKVWLMHVGRIKLYLLDCNVEGNKPEDRELTSRLYGGDERTRIRQELVLGVGGVKALRALGIYPGVYHLNEGHSAFAALEVMRERMHDDGQTFDNALREVARSTVFTTHTPVPAGHDRFDGVMIEEHLGPLRDQLGISADHLMSLGRVHPDDHSETFCMTVLALKLSRRANAVSQLHGHISRRMWQPLWPDRTSKAGLLGKCNSFTIAIFLPVGNHGWVSQKFGNTSTKSIRGNCGKHITRSKICLSRLSADESADNRGAVAKPTISSKQLAICSIPMYSRSDSDAALQPTKERTFWSIRSTESPIY